MKNRQTVLPYDPEPDRGPVWQQLPERSLTTVIALYARLISQAARPRQPSPEDENPREEKDEQRGK